MMTLLFIAVFTIVIGTFLTIAFNYWGVLFASIITGFAAALIIDGLRGFGSPTGAVPKSNPQELLVSFLVCLAAGAIFYLGVFFAKTYFSGNAVNKIPFFLWLGVVAIGTFGYLGQQIYLNNTKREFSIELGYDKEKPINDVLLSAELRNKSSQKRLFFNGRSSSLEKSRFGFYSSLNAFEEIHFTPTELAIKLFEKAEVVIPLPPDIDGVVLYINQDLLLHVYIQEKLVETRQLK